MIKEIIHPVAGSEKGSLFSSLKEQSSSLHCVPSYGEGAIMDSSGYENSMRRYRSSQNSKSMINLNIRSTSRSRSRSRRHSTTEVELNVDQTVKDVVPLMTHGSKSMYNVMSGDLTVSIPLSPNKSSHRSPSKKSRSNRSPSKESRRSPTKESRRSPSKESRRSPVQEKDISMSYKRTPVVNALTNNALFDSDNGNYDNLRNSTKESNRSPTKESRRSSKTESRHSSKTESRRSPTKESRHSPHKDRRRRSPVQNLEKSMSSPQSQASAKARNDTSESDSDNSDCSSVHSYDEGKFLDFSPGRFESPKSVALPHPSHSSDNYSSNLIKVFKSEFDIFINDGTSKDLGCDRDEDFRRTVFEVISKINDLGPLLKDSQRDILLKSLLLLTSSENSPNADVDLKNRLEVVATFLLKTFHFVLTSVIGETVEEELKIIIRLAGRIGLKSSHHLNILHQNYFFKKLIDDMWLFLPSSDDTNAVSLSSKAVAERVVKMTLNSQLVIRLCAELKTVLQDLSSRFTGENSDSCYKQIFMIAGCLAKVDDLSGVLSDVRTNLKHFVQQHTISSVEKEYFRSSNFLSRLMSRCDYDDTSSCSHILKIVIILREELVLKELLVEEHAAAVGKLFLSYVRSEESDIELSLVKFWLVCRMCEHDEFRDMLFCTEGVILAIMHMMRAVSPDVGEELSVLTPLFDKKCFHNLSLTNGKFIQELLVLFQHGISDEERRSASDLLLVFAEGLFFCPTSSSDISRDFIDASAPTVFLQVLQVENNSLNSEWRDRCTCLIGVLMGDTIIRSKLLQDSLSAFHILVNSYNSYEHRSTVYVSLITLLRVVVPDHNAHSAIFDSGVVLDLADHIKSTLTTCAGVSNDDKTAHVLECLGIFELISDAAGSCSRLKDLKLDILLKVLYNHDNTDVREAVSRVLGHVGAVVTPNKWRLLFKAAEVAV